MAGIKHSGSCGAITIEGIPFPVALWDVRIDVAEAVALCRGTRKTLWMARFGDRILRVASRLPPWIEGHRARMRLAELLFIEGECFDRSLLALAKYHKMVIRP